MNLPLPIYRGFFLLKLSESRALSCLYTSVVMSFFPLRRFLSSGNRSGKAPPFRGTPLPLIPLPFLNRPADCTLWNLKPLHVHRGKKVPPFRKGAPPRFFCFPKSPFRCAGTAGPPPPFPPLERLYVEFPLKSLFDVILYTGYLLPGLKGGRIFFRPSSPFYEVDLVSFDSSWQVLPL